MINLGNCDDINLLKNAEALMASKSQCRNTVKDKTAKLNSKPSQNVLADEIALRDEIFELKREILLLKKANERNLLKVRKYEDEAKKKDRQIEQLMDPVKNGDVRKLLSTKGAALLLNLKEQNNALIQMVLAKDMQIRKLLSELKTSKLYTNTKRAESYRNEIDRLRNLLIKSQNTVKETQEMHQRNSASVGAGSVRDMTLSSEQSSPRDLEELHFTIQSLETHMKYSNELLAKKNEQIIQLTDELNSYQCTACRRSTQPKFFPESTYRPDTGNIRRNPIVPERDFPTSGEYVTIGPTSDSSHNSKFVTNNGEFYEYKSLSTTSTPARNFQDGEDALLSKQTTLKQEVVHADVGQECCGGETNLHDNKMDQTRTAKSINCTNDTKTEPVKYFVTYNSGISGLHRIIEKASASSLTEEESDVDTEEFEMMEKKIENDQTEIESPVKLSPQVNGHSCNSDLDKLSSDEKLFLVQSNKPDSEGGTTMTLELTLGEQNKGSTNEETNQNLHGESPENGNEETYEGNHCGTPENDFVIDRVGASRSESIRDSYRYSSDSSFDSQITTGNPVQVEAEINHNGEMEENTKAESDDDDDEHEVIANKTFNESSNNGDDDDDDVVTG